jgi:hypothetical protein
MSLEELADILVPTSGIKEEPKRSKKDIFT